MLFQRNCRRRILTGEEWRKTKNVKRTRNESRRNYYENIKQEYLPVFRRQMFSQAPKNSYPWHTSSHLERKIKIYLYIHLIWCDRRQVGHWSLPSLSARATPLLQLPPSCQTTINEIKIRVHISERKILISAKHLSVPRLSFCPYVIHSSKQLGGSGGHCQ